MTTGRNVTDREIEDALSSSRMFGVSATMVLLSAYLIAEHGWGWPRVAVGIVWAAVAVVETNRLRRFWRQWDGR